MATATIDGITTRYELIGDGPPLLMYAPVANTTRSARMRCSRWRNRTM